MKQKVLVIAGPTAVGKSACALTLAKQYHGEIINGDAMQVYQGLDIGTAKITKAQMQGITHHLLDCFSYDATYNVKIFQEKARRTLDEITSRGNLPIVCGGTGLYLKSLLYDYEFVDQVEDEEFTQFLATLSSEQLYALLRRVDETSAAQLHPHNHQRIIRALCMAHGGHKKSEVISSQRHDMLYDTWLIGLTMPREQLYQRIDARVDEMLENGLYEEVASLVKQDANIWQCQSFQSIGYKEWRAHFEQGGDCDECIRLIKKHTRNFAKRQATWFRNQLPMHWYDVSEANWQNQIEQDVREWLKQP
ncbi:MAG: tRNA (adenosine(37)-N6)-dimethylallyltransferase MiaA [Erysipelotrichaceae bacterium]|nr:tRNA (adenosine(37)-N6)-dimethylallyltransferase MiaA [Erysipelotrichaceae bacterium]